MYAMGYQIQRVAISGSNGPRASLFAPATKEIFGLGGMMGRHPVLASYSLGQTAQDYYNDAKKELARFESIAARVARIANQTERNRLIDVYGLTEPTNKDKATYMHNALASDVASAEKYSPIAYEEGFPSHGPSRGRVRKLKNFDDDFDSEVTNAERTYGILPEPVVIERVVTAPGAAAATPSALPYVLVGGGIVAALAISGII